MARLVRPTVELYRPWREARLEWGLGLHEDGFGLRADDDTSTLAGFTAWVARLGGDPGRAWWIVEDDAVAGGIALRADDDPAATRHGHVGYGIRPSYRGRGLATWALREVMRVAAAEGRRQLVVVCARENVASARVIASVGGTRCDGDGRVDRYRVELREPGARRESGDDRRERTL